MLNLWLHEYYICAIPELAGIKYDWPPLSKNSISSWSLRPRWYKAMVLDMLFSNYHCLDPYWML